MDDIWPKKFDIFRLGRAQKKCPVRVWNDQLAVVDAGPANGSKFHLAQSRDGNHHQNGHAQRLPECCHGRPWNGLLFHVHKGKIEFSANSGNV